MKKVPATGTISNPNFPKVPNTYLFYFFLSLESNLNFILKFIDYKVVYNVKRVLSLQEPNYKKVPVQLFFTGTTRSIQFSLGLY